MKQYPELSFGDVSLKEFTPEFLTDKYVSWLNNSEIVKYSEQRHRTHTIEECREFYKSIKNELNYFWAVVIDEVHIGNIVAYCDAHNGLFDISILIGEQSYHGKGYAKIAFKLACEYLISLKQTRKITAGTMSVNLPMIHLMKSVGMQEDGVFKKEFVWQNQEVDMIRMALFS